MQENALIDVSRSKPYLNFYLCFYIIKVQQVNRLLFEWDDEKAAINLKKHGVSFQTAALVFYDENRIEMYDSEHSLEEDRYNTIGMVEDVLFVVYTERKDRLRIISARLANKKERSMYYERYL
jgi:uncharacterized DUF497 family protein